MYKFNTNTSKEIKTVPERHTSVHKSFQNISAIHGHMVTWESHISHLSCKWWSGQAVTFQNNWHQFLEEKLTVLTIQVVFNLFKTGPLKQNNKFWSKLSRLIWIPQSENVFSEDGVGATHHSKPSTYCIEITSLIITSGVSWADGALLQIKINN